MKKKSIGYDKAVRQLEEVVSRIQSGEMGLEEMRKEVKSALDLIRQCKSQLHDIETDIERLLETEMEEEE
jgi:exodeoxyribonuclease VII small subunit